MSGSLLRIIPTDPGFVPSLEAEAEAVAVLHSILESAGFVLARRRGGVRYARSE
jgi:hypothetical protein